MSILICCYHSLQALCVPAVDYLVQTVFKAYHVILICCYHSLQALCVPVVDYLVQVVKSCLSHLRFIPIVCHQHWDGLILRC